MILNYTSESYLIEIGPVNQLHSNEKTVLCSIFYILNKTILVAFKLTTVMKSATLHVAPIKSVMMRFSTLRYHN